MVIWFALRNEATFRFCEPIVRELHARGHTSVVSFALGGDADAVSVVRAAGARLEPYAASGSTRTARWADFHRTLVSYYTLRRRWRPLLRGRWLDYFPSPVVRMIGLVDDVGLSRLADSRSITSLLRSTSTLWPVPRAAKRQLRAIGADLVVASPLIVPGSNELEAVRAARSAGVATAGIVLSWDNLTSKGLFHALPDRLLVWNDAQVREAVEWHGVEPDRLEVVGAPVYDYLFDRRQRLERATALELLGLPADARYVLWAGSSRLALGVEGEARLVGDLAAAIAATPWVEDRRPRVVVRPHPTLRTAWEARTGGAISLAPAAFPVSEREKDELAVVVGNADAVVGLNTSLFLDAAVLGVPTLALSVPGERSPAAIAHFDHLVRGGFVTQVADAGAAAEELARLRREGDRLQDVRESFVASFLRPCGLELRSAAVAAERLASNP
jgi:hypothetical protein